MPEPIDTTILDPETLARMDEEFMAGKYDSIALPPAEPLDPRSDPFGTGYEWLDPADEFAAAYAQVVAQFPSDLRREAAGEFRRLSLAQSFAAGTDQELFEAWVREGFLPLCRSAGDDLAERIQRAAGPSVELTRAVTRLLRRLPGFDELEPVRQVGAAYAVIDAARKHLRPA